MFGIPAGRSSSKIGQIRRPSPVPLLLLAYSILLYFVHLGTPGSIFKVSWVGRSPQDPTIYSVLLAQYMSFYVCTYVLRV